MLCNLSGVQKGKLFCLGVCVVRLYTFVRMKLNSLLGCSCLKVFELSALFMNSMPCYAYSFSFFFHCPLLRHVRYISIMLSAQIQERKKKEKNECSSEILSMELIAVHIYKYNNTNGKSICSLFSIYII